MRPVPAATLRILLCAALVLALPAVDFEMARHAVHHLGSPDNDCRWASTASNVPAIGLDGTLPGQAAPHLIASVPGLDDPRPLARPVARHQGRAPPLLVSI
ncbi:MAG TPA: hypothetical protein VFE48_23175 [Methylomirabilota bacterium]|nr:hypothetical protein [Methylomirabilota bacterium]